MNVYAVAAREFWLGTALAVGAWPKAAPPLRMDVFDPRVLEGRDLIYLCLHGLAGQGHLYGDKLSTVMSAEQVRGVDVGGAAVYLAGCFGDGRMAEAFVDAGASCVVGDRDVTWAGAWWPMGSNRLGRLFVQGLRRGLWPEQAYARARERFRETSTDARDAAILDTVRLLKGTRPNVR